MDARLSLCTDAGDVHQVTLARLEYAPIFRDGAFWIRVSSDRLSHEANVYLMQDIEGSQVCLGSASKLRAGEFAGRWLVELEIESDNQFFWPLEFAT